VSRQGVASTRSVRKRPTSARPANQAGSGGMVKLDGGTRPATAARARCRALLTDAGVVSRSAAVSAALYPSTSRSSSTARCVAGRCCRAATEASYTLSRRR
jgi:hypothetical protein